MELLLGHNQFLGISHISEDRSRERKKKFSDVKNIYNVVENAAELGFKGMIVETHPHMLDFLKYYKKNQTFDIDFYLQLPYAQGYIQKMNEDGLTGLVMEVIRRGGIKTMNTTLIKTIINYVKKDYIKMAVSFLKFEWAPFRDIEIKSLLLHNVLTDLLLSLGISSALKEYRTFVEEEMENRPGFITLNFNLLKKSFEQWDIKNHIIMTPVNPSGFDMNPSRESVETAIREYKGDIIAMNILGGGAFSLSDSYEYLKTFNNIKYSVVGASSKNHLKELSETLLK